MGTPQLTAQQIASRQSLAGAEMAAVCAVMARHGLPSPYGGDGWTEMDDAARERDALMFEQIAIGLIDKSDRIRRGEEVE